MWASAGHLCRCQTTQGWFFFYLTTLTAQLLSKGGLDIKMHHVSFPLPCGEQEREPSEAAHPCLPCCLSLSQSRPAWAWRACVTCRHLLWFGLSWQEQLRIEEPCDCRISTKSVLFATVIVLETTLLSILSKSIPKFYLIGRSGAGMSWCLWVSPPASGTNKTSSTK